MSPAGTLPDFVIIGRMKAGTTSLSKWLAAQPEVFFCRVDEPRFFNDDENWAKGLEWYSSLFRGAGGGRLLGEASPAYTHPSWAQVAADRMARTIPEAKLIYLVRHPVDRIRAEYRHRRMMGDEQRRPLVEALQASPVYVRHSMYHEGLKPYTELFPRQQLLVVRLDDLTRTGGQGWATVLDHLGLPRRPVPEERHNVSADKGLYRSAVRLRRNVELRRRMAWIPVPVRRLASRALRRRGPEFRRMLAESRAPIPAELVAPVWDDLERLQSWLGTAEPLWRRESGLEGET